jgi:hypothetical protein
VLDQGVLQAWRAGPQACYPVQGLLMQLPAGHVVVCHWVEPVVEWTMLEEVKG